MIPHLWLKSYVNFRRKRLVSLKNCQMRPQNIFLRFSLKIQLFSKKLLNKKMFRIKFLIKKAIFIFGVRSPLTGSIMTQLDFYVLKYRSSDALPAPEIFYGVWTPSLYAFLGKKFQATVVPGYISYRVVSSYMPPFLYEIRCWQTFIWSLIMRIYGCVQPKSECIFPFLYNLIFQLYHLLTPVAPLGGGLGR